MIFNIIFYGMEITNLELHVIPIYTMSIGCFTAINLDKLIPDEIGCTTINLSCR